MDQCTSWSAPCATSGGVTPKYDDIASSHHAGSSDTRSLFSSSRFSASKRSITCSEYVTSSASTRMSEGCTLLTARYIFSASKSAAFLRNAFLNVGKKNCQNARERPTRFSHSRDCDSCTPSDVPPASAVRSKRSGEPCSYSACPPSCSAPKKHELKKSGSTRLVTRTS